MKGGRKWLNGVTLLIFVSITAQEIKIVQENDDVLFFNETGQTQEVWLELDDLVINEIIPVGVMKKYVNDGFLTRNQIESSEIYAAYSYKALAHDVKNSMDRFYQDLEQKRSIFNRGYELINKPFYRTDKFEVFLETNQQKELLQQLQAKNLNNFVATQVIPSNRSIMNHVDEVDGKSKKSVENEMSRFIATNVMDEKELSMFLTQMNKLETLFYTYSNPENTQENLGSLADNGFKFFERKGNPGTNFGVYLTTNNLKLIKNYNYREMETRGFNFEVEFSQRLHVMRVAKRRTINLYGATSYLSIKDKEYDLKKSFINVGPQIRYAGFYENQLELVGEAGATIDITADKYMNPDDTKQLSFYAGGQVSLLFFRFGMRYYSHLTEPEFSPEGQWFYRLGLVAKF